MDDYFYQWVHQVDIIDLDSVSNLPGVSSFEVIYEFNNLEKLLSKLLLGRLPKSEGDGFYGLGRDILSRYGSMESHLILNTEI